MILWLPSCLYASDVRQPQSTLFDFRSTAALQDDFITGDSGSGIIGALGWGSAGTISATGPFTNRPGVVSFDTSAVINTIARIGQFGTNTFSGTPPHKLTWLARLNTNDANTTIRIGASSSFVANPPVSGSYFEKLDADTNWFCVTRNSNVQTRTDSTVAITTSFDNFSYTKNSSGVQFSINNVNVCGLINTNVTSGNLGMGAHIINSAAASKSFDVDYAELILQGLVR